MRLLTYSPNESVFDVFFSCFSGDLAGSVWADAGAPGQEQSCATRTGVSDCNTFVQNNGAAFQDACVYSISHSHLLITSKLDGVQIGNSTVSKSIKFPVKTESLKLNQTFCHELSRKTREPR